MTEFAVEMLVIEDSSTKEVHRGAPSVTECLVNGLLPGRQYSFKVKAFNRVGVSVYNVWVWVWRCVWGTISNRMSSKWTATRQTVHRDPIKMHPFCYGLYFRN